MIDILAALWTEVTGERLDPDAVRITGDEQVLPGPFRVTAAASACVAATTLAATALRGGASGPVEVVTRHAAKAFRSERHLRVNEPLVVPRPDRSMAGRPRTPGS